MPADPKHFHCGFCAKHQSEVAKLIAGPICFICNECIVLCYDILGEEVIKDTRETKVPGHTFPFPDPELPK